MSFNIKVLKGDVEMFEKASRLKLRFETTKGQLTVEDLWQLPLTSASGPNLDDIAVALDKKLKDTTNVSFVHKKLKSDQTTQLKFDIVRHIIDVRLFEQEQSDKAKDIADQKQKILRLMSEKQDEALKGSSIEELQRMLDELK
jgi:hypothetical protein